MVVVVVIGESWQNLKWFVCCFSWINMRVYVGMSFEDGLRFCWALSCFSCSLDAEVS